MSFELGSNGGERVEVPATQGGRRVAIYRAQEIESLSTYCTRSLRLAHTGVSGWTGHSGVCWPDTPIQCGGKHSIRRVSDSYYCKLSHLVTLAEKSPAGHSGRCTPDNPAGRILRPVHTGYSGLHHFFSTFFLGVPHKAAVWEGWCMDLCKM